MKVFVIGGGGREHAIGWRLKQDPRVTALFFAPGNAGTAALGENVAIPVQDITALAAWGERERPDLTVVGPEVPLCLGVVDAFEALGLPIFGPNRAGAQLEGSKVFTKNILEKYGIPTARSASFTTSAPAHHFSQKLGYPQVIKADGLAAGKGVIIAENPETAAQAIYDIMDRQVFGGAGASLLIEEFLEGQEVSVHGVTDGKTFQLFPAAQDHKRAGDGDTGLNTGGMGAYAPAPVLTPELQERVAREVFVPLLTGLKAEGIDFRGVLYAGLMLTAAGPKVLEFNVRFGDPETQVLMPLLETPLIDLCLAVWRRNLEALTLKFSENSAMTVVMAAEGYPAEPRKGDVIHGVEEVTEKAAIVFHSGTAWKGKSVVSNGGRVLTVTAWAPTLALARDRAYQQLGRVHFDGAHYRRDIGARELKS